MSGKTVEWLAVLIFFIFFFAITVLEAYWLNKRSAVPLGKTFVFSSATNIFTITVGFTLAFIAFGALVAFAGDGAGIARSGLGAAIGVGALTLLAISVVIKRLGLRVAKLDGAAPPWLFSLVGSLVFLFAVTVPLILFNLFV
jgi:hypothetical protein